MTNITIRPAIMEDLPRLVQLGRMMHGESLYRDITWDDDVVYKLGTNAIHNDFYLITAAESGSEMLGFFIGYYSPYFFSRELVAQDLALFVVPNKRGSLAAKALIEHYVEWAREKGCREACLATTTGVRTEQSARLFEKLEFKCVGSVHKRGL